MRNAFADELTKLADHDPRIVLLSGDIGNRLFDRFKAGNGDRFFNCGIAEANMMSMAAGMAMMGQRPVVYTITPFTTTRCLEQIRVGVCYHDVPVVIVGTGSGLSYASLGPTHHSLEDMAFLRALPGMTVFAPCDTIELRCGLRKALQHKGPVYIRIGKKNEPRIHEEEFDLELGKAVTLRTGTDVCLIGAGNIMPELVAAADGMEKAGILVGIESFHTVKPLDTERLETVFANHAVVGVVEEHSRIGGLNGAIAEWLVSRPVPPKARMVGFAADDRFLHTIGTQAYARREYGIDAQAIQNRIQTVMQHAG